MIRFVHTNIITDNWQRLADFYINVFGCKPVLPERDLSGSWLDKATGVVNSHIRGIYLTFPGYESNPPTLEIFEYNENVQQKLSVPNQKGFAHIAFQVSNVDEILNLLLEKGGSQVGEIAKVELENTLITFVYARDIDGNIVEIQNRKTINP